MARNKKDKNLQDTFQDAVDSVKTSIKKVKPPKTKDRKNSPAKEGKKNKKRRSDIPTEKRSESFEMVSVSTKSAIKIIYFLMAADGEIKAGEVEKFESICSAFDPEFDKTRMQIVFECEQQLSKATDSENRYVVLQEGVKNALFSSAKTEDTFITPKLLVWNLLAIAFSDERYHEIERNLIQYIVERLNIDKAVFLEMESSILTLADLERELN